VAGVRVTDEAGLAVAEEVLSRINGDVVSAFQGVGLNAVAMAGHTGHVVTCAKKPPMKVKDDDGSMIEADLGLVGEVSAVDVALLKGMMADGKVPVIYPICETAQEVRMNVNADTVAYGVASALECDELIMVTDVPGVLMDVNDPGSLRPELTVDEVGRLIDQGIIRDGMVPKVEGCIKALEAGVMSTRMVNGRDKGSILGDLSGEHPKGTRIHKG